jgi:hypothetical protein
MMRLDVPIRRRQGLPDSVQIRSAVAGAGYFGGLGLTGGLVSAKPERGGRNRQNRRDGRYPANTHRTPLAVRSQTFNVPAAPAFYACCVRPPAGLSKRRGVGDHPEFVGPTALDRYTINRHAIAMMGGAMRTGTRRPGIFVAILGLAFCGSPASGQGRGPLQLTPQAPGQPPDIAFYGVWTIDMPATVAARGGQPLNLQTLNITDTFTWIFTPEKDGFRMAVYASYPAPKESRSYFARLDGQPYPDPHGPGRGLGGCVGDCQEFIRLVALDRYTIARQVTTKGKWTERVMYALSEDGNTLVVITPSPADPASAGRMIFRRREPAK